nr:MAG TPA: hypothetical protein [Caudoviricetes sp.]
MKKKCRKCIMPYKSSFLIIHAQNAQSRTFFEKSFN